MRSAMMPDGRLSLAIGLAVWRVEQQREPDQAIQALSGGSTQPCYGKYEKY